MYVYDREKRCAGEPDGPRHPTHLMPMDRHLLLPSPLAAFRTGSASLTRQRVLRPCSPHDPHIPRASTFSHPRPDHTSTLLRHPSAATLLTPVAP